MINTNPQGASRLCRFGLVRGLGLLSGALLIVVLSLLSLGCAGGRKTIVAGGELQKIGGSHSVENSIVARTGSLTEAIDGTLLLEWSNHSGNFEAYSQPGKESSNSYKLLDANSVYGPDRVTVAFNGRGERLAVWGGLTFDVRRPGAEKPLLQASLRLRPKLVVFDHITVEGSNGCDFLVNAAGLRDGYNGPTIISREIFLVRCKPKWTVTRVDLRGDAFRSSLNRSDGYIPTFDARGHPALFWIVSPPHSEMDQPAWERLFYAKIGPDGQPGSAREIATLTKLQELDTGMAVQGTRVPTYVWVAWNGDIWQATPAGASRLVASKGGRPADEGFDAIADDEGGAIVAWPAFAKKNYDDITWISLPTAHGRRTESVGSGSRPVLARAGKKLFVNVDLGGERAIFTRRGHSWKQVNLGENSYSGGTTGASGPRAVFAWTHDNKDDSGDVLSTDLYTWIYPRP